MKRIVVILCLLTLVCSSVYAQKISDGSFKVLSVPQKIDLEIDFDSGLYKGLTFEELVNAVCPGVNSQKDWEIKAGSLRGKFMHYLIERIAPKGYMVGSYKNGEATYRLTMKINYVSPQGDVSANYIISEISTGNKVVEFYDTSEGGMFGTFMNLFGDGLTDAGDRIGKFIIKQIRRSK